MLDATDLQNIRDIVREELEKSKGSTSTKEKPADTKPNSKK